MTTHNKIPPQPKDDAKADKAKADAKTADENKAAENKAGEQGGEPGAGVASIAPNANPAPGTDPVAEMAARAEAQTESDQRFDGAAAGDAELNQLGDSVKFTDEKTYRGRVITISKVGADGPTITREAIIPTEATDEQVAATKSRLIKQFVDA